MKHRKSSLLFGVVFATGIFSSMYYIHQSFMFSAFRNIDNWNTESLLALFFGFCILMGLGLLIDERISMYTKQDK